MISWPERVAQALERRIFEAMEKLTPERRLDVLDKLVAAYGCECEAEPPDPAAA